MAHINIDGQNIGFSFKHDSKPVYQKILELLKDNEPFILHDGNREGPIFIPSHLACIEQGEVLIHKGIAEFQFSLSFQAGLYSCADKVSLGQIDYMVNKLLPYSYAATRSHT